MADVSGSPSQLSDNTSLNTQPRQPLKPGQKQKLGEMFQHIISKAPIDYSKKEIKDIQSAVDTMLERIMTRVNDRGIFNIGRILPSGSMTEKTSLWRCSDSSTEGGLVHYLEFDNLAVLGNSMKQQNNSEGQCGDILKDYMHYATTTNAQHNCPGCITIESLPVDLERLQHWYSKDDEFNTEPVEGNRKVNCLFLKEINSCLTRCGCLSLSSSRDAFDRYKLSLRPTTSKLAHGCDMCTVDTPTGTLNVNTVDSIDQVASGHNDCSLIFRWTSKAMSLSAPDRLLLQEPQTITSLLVYVDFLPAMESIKPTPIGFNICRIEHDCFILPKRCNMCGVDVIDVTYKWRKSWCKAELDAFATELSDKHKACYQIMKYFSSILPSVYSANGYHIKTSVLRHHEICTDTTNDYVECVIKIFHDLLQAYKSGELLSYQSNINILSGKHDWNEEATTCEAVLDELCSLDETDSWETLVGKWGYLLKWYSLA